MNEPMNGRKRPGAPTASKPGLPPVPPRRPAEASESDEPVSLSADQVAELRAMLESRRAELATAIDGRREDERSEGREVGDEMDDANTEGVTAMASKLLERDVNLLREIDRALVKLKEGTYGLCEGTGEPIGFSRLKLRPWARYSVEYQEELERAERGRGGV
jgi:DnaK suppressor protein